MTAIRRILQSISGKFPEMYPKLEEVLEQPIAATLTSQLTTSTDEGLTCLAELVYNQDRISPRMWHFFQLIVNSILTDQGVFDEYLQQVFAVFIGMLNKEPEVFKTAQVPPHN